jgi:hypothetical protein
VVRHFQERMPYGLVVSDEYPKGCLRRAEDAKQRAAQASDPSIKSAYEKVAEYWMLLARLESLLGDEKK